MTADERLKADGYEYVEPVLFYKGYGEEYSCFSNFSPHAVEMPDPFTGAVEYYMTTEHRFQAMKSSTAAVHTQIRLASSAGVSKDLGSRRNKELVLRDGWGENYGDLCWYVMLECLIAKAIQNDDVFSSLMGTGERPLYEDSPVDDKWGWRYQSNHSGKNLLGRCWMDVRDILS